MARVVNDAAPPEPVTAVSPDRDAPAGPDAMVAMTGTPAWATGLPLGSCNWTTGCVGSGMPLCADGSGLVAKASFAAVDAVTSNAPLVAPFNPAALACKRYPVPWRSTLRFEKVASPRTAVTAVAPVSVAPEVPVPGAITTLTVPP